MKAQVLIADCPWKMSDNLSMSSVKRGASSNYPTMSINDLCALPVKDIADPDGCVLALWVVGSMLEDGLKVMKSWGFKQKQVYVWVKSKQESSISQLLNRLIGLPISNRIRFLLDNLLSFGMGRLFRQSHEICLIGVNNTKIYQSLKNKSQRSVCFAKNDGHSIKPDNLHKSLEMMFPNAKKIELFSRRSRDGWICLGNAIDGKDIKQSLQEYLSDNVQESPSA